MRLTKKALEAIINNKRIRPHMTLALKCSVDTLFRYLSNNDDNLTKAAALEVIERETGLTREEILEV